MQGPDFTRREIIERFPYGDGAFCGLEWQPLADGRLLMTAYEHSENPGRCVTDAAEDIVSRFIDATGVDPARLVWTESYLSARWKEPPERVRENWQRWRPVDLKSLGRSSSRDEG